jgi:riboflavin synthase
MFTGIIEATGKVKQLKHEEENLLLIVEAPFANELKVDQSVSHNGVCLTVVDANEKNYSVICIAETLSKTNLGKLKTGDEINLERSLKLSDRLDGHLVQGHVDETSVCKNIEEKNGSWIFSFEYKNTSGNILVPKGSVCVNGVSLTVVDVMKNFFSVAIIPYTFEHTNFHSLKKNSVVNIEFDVIGKYATHVGMSDEIELLNVSKKVHQEISNKIFDTYNELLKLQQEIILFVADARQQKSINKKMVIDIVSYKEIELLKKIGLDVTGFKRIMDYSAVRHILKGHGDPQKENERGQIAISESDFIFIPYITKHFSNIRFSKNRIGLTVILYEYKGENIIYYLEEVRTGKKELALSTMYKKIIPAKTGIIT